MLDGKRIVVTGGARGIGAAVVRAYVGAGARVAILDVREELGEALARELGEACFFARADVCEAADVEAGFARVERELGGLDVLAAVAGLDKPGPAASLKEADWDLVLDVNAKGTFLTNQAAFRLMREGGGSIINFGSNAGVRGMAERAAYSAAKAAVAGWSRAVAKAWAEFGVRVNTVVPIMHTEVAEKSLARMSPEDRRATEEGLARAIPMGGRLGDPDLDLAPLMLFLAGPGSRYITGQVLAVDGGMTMLGA
jgi:NAD(P)-dependent dehydrogenase (short-subunit alcohol dehydrogenase family)